MIRTETNAQQIIKRLNEIDNVLTRAAFAVMESGIRKIHARMKKPGSRVRYPINWDSVKQMIAFFASNGFGQGIPTRRTGQRAGGWKLRTIKNGYELSNKEPGAVFLFGRADGLDISPGKKQSNIHKGRWPLFRPVVDEEVKKLPQSLIARIKFELAS